MSSLDEIRVFQFTHNLHHVPILAWWYLRIWWRFGLGRNLRTGKKTVDWTEVDIILGWTEGFNRWGVKNSWGNFTPMGCLLASSSLKELWGAAQERPAMRAGRKYFTNPGYVMIMTYNNNTTRVTWQKYHYPMNNLASSDQIMLKRTLNVVVWKQFDCVNNGLACLKSRITSKTTFHKQKTSWCQRV